MSSITFYELKEWIYENLEQHHNELMSSGHFKKINYIILDKNIDSLIDVTLLAMNGIVIKNNSKLMRGHSLIKSILIDVLDKKETYEYLYKISQKNINIPVNEILDDPDQKTKLFLPTYISSYFREIKDTDIEEDPIELVNRFASYLIQDNILHEKDFIPFITVKSASHI